MNRIKQLIDYFRSPHKDFRIKNLEGMLSMIFRIHGLNQLEGFKSNAAMLLGRTYKIRNDSRIIIRLMDVKDTVILSTVAKDLTEALAGVQFVTWFNDPVHHITSITYTYRGDIIMKEKVDFRLSRGVQATSLVYAIQWER